MLRRHHLIALALAAATGAPALAQYSTYDLGPCSFARQALMSAQAALGSAQGAVSFAEHTEQTALSAFRLAKAAVEAANCDWEGRDKPQCPNLQADYRAKLNSLTGPQNAANAARAVLQELNQLTGSIPNNPRNPLISP